jgi:hypothetical protein
MQGSLPRHGNVIVLLHLAFWHTPLCQSARLTRGTKIIDFTNIIATPLHHYDFLSYIGRLLFISKTSGRQAQPGLMESL